MTQMTQAAQGTRLQSGGTNRIRPGYLCVLGPWSLVFGLARRCVGAAKTAAGRL